MDSRRTVNTSERQTAARDAKTTPDPGEVTRQARFTSPPEVWAFRGTQLAVVVSMAGSAQAGGDRRPAERLAADLTPGPGLTLIIGRNGSDKSSLHPMVVPSVVPRLAPGD
jgi:hypothetical protein